MIQLGKFVGGGWVADTNYLYPACWGWIKAWKVCGWGGWLTPTTYIQLAGAGSIIYSLKEAGYLGSCWDYLAPKSKI